MSAAARLLAVWLLVLAPSMGAHRGAMAAAVSDEEVHAIASQLRCVVCQNLSVADSPSEMASQMRGVIKERLAAGDRPEQVVHYFVDKYGEWVLLSPPRRGFTLLVWVVPALAVLVGFGIVSLLLRRWMRRPAGAVAPPVDPAMSERIRREMDRQA